MNFERNTGAYQVLQIGLKANAIEIGNFYVISWYWESDNSSYGQLNGVRKKTLNIIGDDEVPEYLNKIVRGDFIHEEFAFEEPIIDGIAPIKTKFLENYKGKWVQYKGVYYEL